LLYKRLVDLIKSTSTIASKKNINKDLDKNITKNNKNNNDKDNVNYDNKTSPKLFYSANYLQTKAIKYGFECHDLRRAYAKKEYLKTKDKGHVMEKLRHTSLKSTNIYLRSRIDIGKGNGKISKKAKKIRISKGADKP